ncbi:MAG: bifunctional metallophosphatase/5'-nucleotidase [Desulfobulbus sp.]|nr:bifunctional metallophosphatase/5'-nucleotidase [Desulfobulbus sp.]
MGTDKPIMWVMIIAVLSLIQGNSLAVTDEQKKEILQREEAEQLVEWQGQTVAGDTLAVQLLALNDFHSQLTAGMQVGGRPVGSAPVLASYLKNAQAKWPGATFFLHAGDHVGASQPPSALLQDEPGLMFFNMLGNTHCRPGGLYDRECNLIGIPGNHEFDQGMAEMLRLVHGGNHRQGPFLQDPYQGAAFPYICANLIEVTSRQPLFQPYVVRMVQGVPIGFIGVLLGAAPSFLSPDSLRGLAIRDESESINHYVRILRGQGVHTIVVMIHQGGYQMPAASQGKRGALVGDITHILTQLDREVDMVLCGHTHTFHNTLVKNNGGHEMLVVQAWPKGTGFAEIQMEINRASGEVVRMRSRIRTTWADVGPGLQPDAAVAKLTQKAENLGNAVAQEVIAKASKPITRKTNAAGESALGDLIADAQRKAMGTDFAFMHPEGIEADIDLGVMTKADNHSVHPTNLNLMKIEMTGEQIYALLNQQWNSVSPDGLFLQVSGLSYIWDAHRPAGQRVVAVFKEDRLLEKTACYTVTVNEYLIGGGDNFTVFTKATNPIVGPFVADALQNFIRTRPQPLDIEIEGRISRIN